MDSHSVSLKREPVPATPRQRLTGSQRSDILGRQQWRCCACPEPLVRYDGSTRILLPMIDEHILPLELGGSNDLTNRELRCIPCARAKTKDDIKRIAKARRIRKRETEGPKPSRIQSRGFQKTLRKKLNGTVVRR